MAHYRTTGAGLGEGGMCGRRTTRPLHSLTRYCVHERGGGHSAEKYRVAVVAHSHDGRNDECLVAQLARQYYAQCREKAIELLRHIHCVYVCECADGDQANQGAREGGSSGFLAPVGQLS